MRLPVTVAATCRSRAVSRCRSVHTSADLSAAALARTLSAFCSAFFFADVWRWPASLHSSSRPPARSPARPLASVCPDSSRKICSAPLAPSCCGRAHSASSYSATTCGRSALAYSKKIATNVNRLKISLFIPPPPTLPDTHLVPTVRSPGLGLLRKGAGRNVRQ